MTPFEAHMKRALVKLLRRNVLDEEMSDSVDGALRLQKGIVTKISRVIFRILHKDSRMSCDI